MSKEKWILFSKFLEFNSFLKFYICACCYVLHRNLIFLIYTISMFYAILIQYFTKNLLIFYVSFLFDIIFYSWNLNLFLYQKNICFILGKLKFVLLLSHFLVNIRLQILTKFFQCCLLHVYVDSTSISQRCFNVDISDISLKMKVEPTYIDFSTLKQRWRIDVESS